MKKIFGLLMVLAITFNACSTKEKKLFKKVPFSSSNLTFKNELKDTPEHNILTYLYYYNGAGVAAADFNNDGLIDLYLTANQGPDKLYLNHGNLEFEDVSDKANINNSGNWTTGVTHVDINNDNLLDIYICKVGDYNTIKGRNLLYVNQGIDENGIPSFKEEASNYGLDFSGFSTQASFFDYDSDGDLDMYLLNHSVHPNRAYGRGSQRLKIDSLSGDRLYKNEKGKFIDVSNEANIFQGKIGYGLGLAVSDINNDGYPDIYIGNDFFENDYLYINQKDGTFKDVISGDDNKLGHTTHFSMGNDIADINNDGLTDIVSLDMLPEDLETYKSSGTEHPFPTYQHYLRNGYSPQFMQNTLHLNLGSNRFSEIGNLAGISATEWSWGSLIADFDNDGHKDLFISNGIKGATNDMDFISFIANDNIQKRIGLGMSKEDMAFINEMPEKKKPNYFFQNKGDLTFENVTNIWYQEDDSFSNGSCYADLDNDGDLDLVVNNINERAFVLENTLNKKNNFLSISFKGSKNNNFGIGAKVLVHNSGDIITHENFITRGYLSSVSHNMLIGTGKDSIIDSLQVIWPSGKYETLKSIATGQRLLLDINNAKGGFYEDQNAQMPIQYLSQTDSLFAFTHKEQPTLEFNRDPLIPFASTNEGPTISIADINNNGLNSIFISGAKGQASSLFSEDPNGNYSSMQQDLFEKNAMNEDVTHIFFDADKDNDLDLLVGSGGNEFKQGPALRPRLYINVDGTFKKDTVQFQGIEINASKVAAVDFDNDGDLDISISADLVPHHFGKAPLHYMFQNNGNGDFIEITDKFSPELQKIGGIKDYVWIDLDNNGFQDFVAVGHWMPVSIFLNNGKTLDYQQNNGLENTHGWWNTLEINDFDKDGDMDLMAGNWGENSKFKASKEKPIKLYSYDFDDNGTVEPLVTYFYKDKETPFSSKDELVKQMPFLNKQFLSYQDFAKASLDELFTSKKLKQADKKEVYELRTSYYENNGKGNFERKKLPAIVQASTVHDIAIDDFNNDGFSDMLIVGNAYEISTQLGRMDAFHNVILQNDKKGGFQWKRNQDFDIEGPARNITKFKIKGKEHYIIGINNGSPIFLTKN